MAETNPLYTGLSQAAWGYFFITFDFSLNSVSILPRFVGYILLYMAIGKLSRARRDLNLLRPLCILLAGYSFVDWLLSWQGRDADGLSIFLNLVVAAATLYFHFQFLTDMAALAQEYQPEGGNLSASIRSHRTAFTLLLTAVSLLESAAEVFPWNWWGGIIVFIAAICCILTLIIIADLFHLRRLVPKLEIGPQ